MLMALPYTVNADKDDTLADREFEYFDKDRDGVLNDREKALARKTVSMILLTTMMMVKLDPYNISMLNSIQKHHGYHKHRNH